MTDIEVRLGADVDSATRNIGSFRAEFQRLVREVEKPLKQVNAFRSLEGDLERGSRAAESARDRVRDLGNELASSAAPTRQLQQAYSAAVAELQRLDRAEAQQKVRLAAMRAELQAAGVDTRNLVAEQTRLRGELSQRLGAGAADASLSKSLGSLGIDRLRQLQAELQSLPEDYARAAQAGFRSAQEQAAAQVQLQRRLAETRAAIREISAPEGGSGSIGFLGKLGLASIAAYSGVEAVGAYVRSADGVRKLNAQLKLATDSQDEFNTAQRALSEQAQDYQAPLASLYQLYSRISPALKDANKSQADALGLSEAITASMKISGATAEESESAIIQFSQALGAGALRGDEFNSVAEQSPRLMRALADGLGVARSQLKAMADNGQLTTDVVVNGLLKELPKLRAEAAKIPKSFEGSLTGLKNEAEQAAAAVDNLTNFTARLTEQVSGMSSVLRKASTYLDAFNRKGAKGIGEVFDANALADQAKFAQDRIALISQALEELRQTGSVSMTNRFALGTGDRGELEAQLKVYQDQLAKVQAARSGAQQQAEDSTKALERTYDERALALADSFDTQAKATQAAATASQSSNDKAVTDRKVFNLQMELLDREQSDARARQLAKEEAAAQAENGVHVDELELLKKYIVASGSTWDDYLQRQQERQRLELAAEKSRQDRLKAARAQATADLKAQLTQQTDALKAAQQTMEQVNGRTEEVLKPFKEAVKQPTVAAAGADYGTASAYKVNARDALQKGDTTAALREAQKALDVIKQIEEAGGNDYGLQGFKQELLDIATGAQELDKLRAADGVNQIQQSIADLQKQLEVVKFVPVSFEVNEDSVAQLTQRIKELAASLSQSFIIQPTIVGPSGTQVQAPTSTTPGTISTDTPTPVTSPTGFDAGGYTGPGGKFEPAGVVHRGEHVQPQEVVREPGALSFLERIRLYGFQNTMQAVRAQVGRGWRGYATGGLVAPRLVPSIPQLSPALAGSGGGEGLGTVVLQLDGKSYSMQASSDQFTALHRESLKKGHRRTKP